MIIEGRDVMSEPLTVLRSLPQSVVLARPGEAHPGIS